MRVSSLVALCLAASLSFAAVADDAITITGTPEGIRTTQDALKRDLIAKKSDYDHLSDAEKQAILRKQDAIYSFLNEHSSFDGLSDDDKRQLINALEAVRALVAQAEDSRMICERVKVIGSNRPQNKCMTAGQRRRIREKLQTEGIRIEN